MPTLFPFTAIVQQERLKIALILNAISPAIGGVLIRGERGAAKSTAARALAQLLPEVAVVADCPFSCDPDRPNDLCSQCQTRVADGEILPRRRRQARFVDLPVSATEDRVVGTLDLERAIQAGERRFEPGILAAANRGILYIDEVNLLDDHVVDLLLDVAAMGVNVVERESISFSHPARFILIGTMNPEEGELRPQLLDRFALVVTIQGVSDPGSRALILDRRLQYEADPPGFYRQWAAEERRLAERIAQAQERLPATRYSSTDLLAIAHLTASYHTPGHRADLAILKTALARAAFEGRDAIQPADITLGAELALPHRIRHDPLQDPTLSARDLETRLDKAYASIQQSRPARETHATPTRGGQQDNQAGSEQQTETAQPEEVSIDQTPGPAPPGDPAPTIPAGAEFRIHRLTTNLDRLTRRQAGRRSLSRTLRKRGHYVASRPGRDAGQDLALDATLRAAAPYQRERRLALALPADDISAGSDVSSTGSDTGAPVSPALILKTTDLRRKIRTRRVGNLILFAVDASWSVAAAERMAATKGAVLSLLQDAYQRRDRVGLIVFRRDRARLVLPFTSSVARARQAMIELPIGGKTPLSHGLLLALEYFQLARSVYSDAAPLLILLTDGAGNIAVSDHLTPHQEMLKLAYRLKQAGIQSIVIDTGSLGPNTPAMQLAAALQGQYLFSDQLKANTLVELVHASGSG